MLQLLVVPTLCILPPLGCVLEWTVTENKHLESRSVSAPCCLISSPAKVTGYFSGRGLKSQESISISFFKLYFCKCWLYEGLMYFKNKWNRLKKHWAKERYTSGCGWERVLTQASQSHCDFMCSESTPRGPLDSWVPFLLFVLEMSDMLRLSRAII